MSRIFVKGTRYKGCDPAYEVEGIQLGKENVIGSVEIFEGQGDALLSISIVDDVIIVSGTIGKRVAWPKCLVVRSKDENRWKRLKELEMAKKRKIDALKSQINEFRNGVDGIMAQDLILEEGKFEKELEPLHISKDEVLDICNMSQVDVVCVTT